MFFKPIIERFGIVVLATTLGIPAKNVRRWVDLDSIPAEWFVAVERAARAHSMRDITVGHLARAAEARRISRDTGAEAA